MASEVSKNSRDIPGAVFIENVESYVRQNNTGSEVLIKSQTEMYGKYKFMETRLVGQKKDLLEKIPDLETTIKTIETLKTQKEQEDQIVIDFKLSDNLYTKARTNPSEDKVYLWLGANIMVEFTHEEAQDFLKRNLAAATKNLTTLSNDLSFLKDQITISEVNIARLHNYQVRKKRELEEQKGK